MERYKDYLFSAKAPRNLTIEAAPEQTLQPYRRPDPAPEPAMEMFEEVYAPSYRSYSEPKRQKPETNSDNSTALVVGAIVLAFVLINQS